jgi:hypothetical protein
MKKCSPSLITKKMHIKTTLNFSSSKTPPTTGVGEDVGKKEPLYTAHGNAS